MNLTQRLQLAQQQQEGRDTRRQDGYDSGSPVFSFQADIERAGNCDYNALRSTLLWARNRSVSYSDLVNHYNSEKSS